MGARQHVAVAVSGGSDSMALLRLCGSLALVHGTSLTALTVDHGLRPESEAEADRVGRWSAAAGIEHVKLRWQGNKPATGLQAAAREARYDLLAGWCAGNGLDAIFTGHTLDDQAETVVMRSRRSQSPHSLASIWPEMVWQGVPVVRPLIGVTRTVLRQYLQAIGQPWIDDPSNENEKFERVRVRRMLASTGIEALANRAATAQSQVRALTAQGEDWLSKFADQSSLGFLALDRDKFAELTLLVRCEVLRRALAYVSPSTRVPLADVERLAQWVVQPEFGGQQRRTLAGTLFAKRQRHILVAREWARISSLGIVPESGRLPWDGRFGITAPPGSHVEPAGKNTAFARPKEIPTYIFAGLPVVTVEGRKPVLPHLPLISAQNAGIGCETIGFPGRLRRLTSWNPDGGNLC
jgi:tRNA(Ile)-lysidine synthase